MEFYIGTHKVNHAKHFDRCFISVNVLRNRKSDFEVNDWILDSGAFTEISTYGYYRHDVVDYANQIERWKLCGNLELAVCQDYMCEPYLLERIDASVGEHQRWTIQRYDKLVRLIDVPIMPVLQGYEPEEYVNHLRQYGNRLALGMRVGVGSVCKRNSKPQEIINVLQAIKLARPDLRLHGFGLKITALANAYVLSLLHSADSMAWSYRARRNGRDANSLEEARLFVGEIEKVQGTKPHQMSLT